MMMTFHFRRKTSSTFGKRHATLFFLLVHIYEVNPLTPCGCRSCILTYEILRNICGTPNACNRSDDKGGEPESLALITKNGHSYVFVGMERSSIIAVFDITDPSNVRFMDAVQNNKMNMSAGDLFENGMQGDMDPEGLVASGETMKLYVCGSVSNTLTIYDIEMAI